MNARRMFSPVVFAAVLLAGAPLTTPSNEARAQTPLHNCDFCHNLHGGTYASLSDFAVTEDLCLSCHGEAGPAQVDRDGTLVDVPKSGREDEGGTFVAHNGSKHLLPTSCFDCHNHEHYVEPNLKMIDDQMQTPNSGERPVVFTAFTGTNSYADGDATYDGVCEVCHTITTEHRNDGSVGGHQAGDDCSACHKHGSGFGGAGGGCAGCHSSPQGARRAVVGEFDRKSHHVDWVAAGYASVDEIPDSDCESCHDQSTHQAGTVRLKNADTGVSTAYAGVPGELETFCVSCHDADGASLAGGAPFSDGLTPPNTTANWTSSSHEGMSTTCADCHGTGHGSLKVSLLTPADVAATAPGYEEEEEGFCFSCHDSDGPATSDVATVFAEPINWTGVATGGNAVTTFNDRHDLQHAAQSVSGALIECTSCHDPHSDAAAQPYRTDPDPTDGHVPGTDWYIAGYQASGDHLSEFCLDCHDGSLPAGTANHSGAGMVNVEAAWQTDDGMGQRDASGGVGLLTGIGWSGGDVMPCSACHLPHPNVDHDFGITSQFAIVDTLRSKDGTTYLQSVYDRKGASTFEYGIVDDAGGVPAQDGGYYCMSCHDRTGMVTKRDCFTCHYHGSKF
jgi:predicted CXXCH cytochrome family protein